MAVNTIGDFIRSVFSAMVNKNGNTFKALLSDGSGGGTVEKIFSGLDDTRKAWTDVKSFYDMRGEMFEKITALFSVLTMLPDDTEQTYMNRLKLLFYRNGHTLWGTRFDILEIFRTLTNSEVYIVNNTDEENLIENGNFERKTAWVLEDCTYEREARFEEATGILFNASGFLSQTVYVNIDTAYFLHFFLKGNIRVKIVNNKGQYWNPNGGETGSWGSAEYYMSFGAEEWQGKSLFFITEAGISNITVTFAFEPGKYAFLDYIRMNEKTGASTFSLIMVFAGKYNDKTAHFAPGEADPIIAISDYTKYGFYAPGEEDIGKTAEGVSHYMGNTPLHGDKSPVLQEGVNDTEPMKGYENMSYNNEKKAFAADGPNSSDDYKSVDYSKASYFDSTFIMGAIGQSPNVIYQDLLEIVQPAGIIGRVEVLTRESDD